MLCVATRRPAGRLTERIVPAVYGSATHTQRDFTMSAVVQLKTKAPQSQPQRRAKGATKALRRQTSAALGIGFVAVTLTTLSLSHLAHGIEVVTASPSWEAWAMAVGIDLGFVALELSQLSAATERVRKAITHYTRPAIIGTLVGSAAMNAFAFASQAAGWMMAPAIVLGVAIPGLIYCLTRIGGALYIDCHARA